MENYPDFLSNYSQSHFMNNGTTKSLQDQVVEEILYGKVPDSKPEPVPFQNMTTKKGNEQYSGDQMAPHYYFSITNSETSASSQSKAPDQNNSCFDFPIDLSNMFFPNSNVHGSQENFPNENTSMSFDLLEPDLVSSGSQSFSAPDEAKNVQGKHSFAELSRDLFSSSQEFFYDVYSKSFENLNEGPEKKSQWKASLQESNPRRPESVNHFGIIEKNIPANFYLDDNNNRNGPESRNSFANGCHDNQKSQFPYENLSSFTDAFGNLSYQRLPDQVTESREHVLPSFKSFMVPDLPVLNTKEILATSKVGNPVPNLKFNQNVENAGQSSKNGKSGPQTWENETPKENLQQKNNSCVLPNNGHGQPKKQKASSKVEDLRPTVSKKSRLDYVKILPAGVPLKQIPIINISLDQVTNSNKISQTNYINTIVPNSLTNANQHTCNKTLSKSSLNSKRSAKKVPVSIKARNAKFLCAEKDLRCRTVRELLETCETLQNKMGPKPKLCPHASSQSIAKPPQNDFSKSLTRNSQHVVREKGEINQPLQVATEPLAGRMKEMAPNPRILDLKLSSKAKEPTLDSMRVYQPMVDAWKMKFSVNKKKTALKPKHFDFSFLQIRDFKYFCNDSLEKRTSKLKLIFSKKKLVYEFQLKDSFDSSSGKSVRHLAIIEIKFCNIVAMWGHKNEFRLEVSEAPHMYVGTRFSNKDQQFGPHQNAKYDRSRTTDLTLGEIYQFPFHYIHLRSMCVSKVLSYLCHFSPRFEQMLRCPLVEDSRKILPQISVTSPGLVPLGINKPHYNNLDIHRQEMSSFHATRQLAV